MKLTKRAMILPAASLLLLSGCGLLNTPQRSEYAAFAQAGAGYTEAVGKVLDAAGKAQVDATSWSIVDIKKKSGTMSEEEYKALTEVDKERIKILKELQGHAVLFGEYLSLLNKLAGSDSPGRIKAEIEGAFKGMAALSPHAALSSPVGPAVTEIFVDARIRKELKEELVNRKRVILKELELQNELLTTLERHILNDLNTVQKIRERQFVILPLAAEAPLAKPEEWVAKRRDIFFVAKEAENINAARQIVHNMSVTFEAITTDKDVVGSINALIIDIERIVAVADALNS